MSEYTYKSYNIKTVDDFFKIPADKIEECLESFKSGMVQAHAKRNACFMSRMLGRIAKLSYTWIDDGIDRTYWR